MTDALRILGLDKKLGGFRMSGVSLALPRGTIMGLVGPNGAGKTTLIKLVLGLLRPDAGEVLVHGLAPERAESRRRVGFVLDEPVFHNHLSAAGLARSIAPFYEDWDQKTFDRLLGEFQVPARKSVGKLSHGTKTKLALAVALSHKADLLVLDEPTTGLDPVFRRSLIGRLSEFLQDESRSVLFSTHITTDLERIADYITFIHRGRVVFSETKDDVLSRWAVVKGGEELMEPARAGLFRAVRRRAFGILGLTDRAEEARRALPAAVVERASLEDIMDFLTRGGGHA